jgi:hypothetical protein
VNELVCRWLRNGKKGYCCGNPDLDGECPFRVGMEQMCYYSKMTGSIKTGELDKFLDRKKSEDEEVMAI